MKSVPPITIYNLLKPEEQANMVSSRMLEFEREHYYNSLMLHIAESKMDKGLENAEAEVIDLRKKLDLIEISLNALGQLIS